MTPSNRAWAGAAPVLVLVAVRATHERNEAVNPTRGTTPARLSGF